MHRRRRVNLFVLKRFVAHRFSSFPQVSYYEKSPALQKQFESFAGLNSSINFIVKQNYHHHILGAETEIWTRRDDYCSDQDYTAMLFIFASDEPTALLAKVRCGDDTRANRTHTCKSWLILYQVAPQAPDVGAHTHKSSNNIVCLPSLWIGANFAFSSRFTQIMLPELLLFVS